MLSTMVNIFLLVEEKNGNDEKYTRYNNQTHTMSDIQELNRQKRKYEENQPNERSTKHQKASGIQIQ